MAGDFEDKLRRSLSARASDVTPDPAAFARVQSRIRRGRTFRLAFAGVAGALAIGGAALAAPGLMDRRVEFEPGPGAGQPTAEVPATPTFAPSEESVPAGAIGSAPMVFTDGKGLYSMALDGEGAEALIPFDCPRGATCDYEAMRHVTAQPLADEVATRGVAAGGCAALRSGGGVEDHVIVGDTCPSSAVFSPEGGHLAYVALAGGDDEWSLHTMDWNDDGPGGDEASFGLGFSPDETVRIDDWTWMRNGADRAEGSIYLQVSGPDGISVVSRDIERQGDGALALPGSKLLDLEPELANYQPLGTVPDYDAVAVSAKSEFEQYVLEVHVADGAVNAAHIAGVDDSYLDLPEDVLEAIDADAIGDLWLTSSGGDIVLGDGTGEAWTVHVAGQSEPSFVRLDGNIVHADLVKEAEAPDAAASEAPRTTSQVDVFFGMTGAEACVADEPVQREVEGPGVARAALTELLEGPSQESNIGLVSPFSANTAGTLIDIEIVEGEARVDFVDFSAQVSSDSCTKSAIVDALDKTLLQFPTIKSTSYSFDGKVSAFQGWLRNSEHSTMPPAVMDTSEAIRVAAAAHEWDELRQLSQGVSCTLSDQPEPCVPVWKEQEANGQDPLGTLVELLEGPGAQVPGSTMWVWPVEAAGGSGYSGPRLGIDADGVWRYYVQESG